MKSLSRKILLPVFLALISILSCFGMTACGTNKLSNDSGFVVEGDFEEDSVLEAGLIDSENEGYASTISIIASQTYDKTKPVYVYEISVKKDGEKVQPNGKVKVIVPVEEDLTGYEVLHIKNSSDVEKLTLTYENGTATFETESFSYFVFVATGTINPIPETGSEAEWNKAINFWQAQNNVRVEEWIVDSHSYEEHGTGAQIMLYQYNGKAHSEDGYEELNPTGYKGKAQYHVANEDGTYSYIYWGYMDDKECWVENPEISKSEYEARIASTIYSFTDLEDGYIVFNYANFSYDSTNKIYKYKANNNITVAFEFTDGNLTKLVVKRYREDDHVTFTSTITFGNANIKVPAIGSAE